MATPGKECARERGQRNNQQELGREERSRCPRFFNKKPKLQPKIQKPTNTKVSVVSPFVSFSIVAVVVVAVVDVVLCRCRYCRRRSSRSRVGC